MSDLITMVGATAPLEMRPNTTEAELQDIIRAVYKQVLGNAHIIDGSEFTSAESMLRNGDMTVRDFVRAVAQSELYQSLYFQTSSQYRFIELNCIHLLGRPPLGQAEIAEHVATYNADGYGADIDSYIDSEEYVSNFGENIVPYNRSANTQAGFTTETFNRTFALLRGPSGSTSNSNASKLLSSLAANLATPVKPAASKSASGGNTAKRFQIRYSTSGAAARLNKYSQKSMTVSFSQMSASVQSIHKTGGRIVSITEEG
ncbi:MAG: photosystem I reaction center subunit XII [Spirulina sp. SIO3F2]|nr:photosystem I reaction center subunit XII [Spirulina sp. SIO3F2]